MRGFGSTQLQNFTRLQGLPLFADTGLTHLAGMSPKRLSFRNVMTSYRDELC
ncbi:uncharacterized protein P174DRAFT_442258 [Aspergillus novofumigatus IBT 16806]|uniref:Uncharacterized protein n=1 Tax=Aspergillus novofumigatus (strain IBT 16806) TaxID=1392255 RepID=A0A2I1C490_ASPN1|nr:uncharacterized protein P174DRAFT_442258 [Aspergillus novofumigatus IBT 16806]PKX92425.1 hypothetical protein P174DRAFT_442258 [Aspergillus novofumigatus IBT 16806]